MENQHAQIFVLCVSPPRHSPFSVDLFVATHLYKLGSNVTLGWTHSLGQKIFLLNQLSLSAVNLAAQIIVEDTRQTENIELFFEGHWIYCLIKHCRLIWQESEYPLPHQQIFQNIIHLIFWIFNAIESDFHLSWGTWIFYIIIFTHLYVWNHFKRHL